MFDSGLIFSVLEVATYLFVFLIGLGIMTLIVLYLIDITQSHQTIRRNYPIIGRLRYRFEDLGVFFRQYFFAMDREEMPFNRAERSWVYRAAKNLSTTIAFGSTRDLRNPGTVLFANCAYPTLGEDAVDISEVTIGPYCQQPYTTRALFNISGMSYGAISKPAIQALSNGARMAGSWINTGEGGLSPYHLEGGGDVVFQIGTAKYGVRTESGELSDFKLAEIAEHEQVKMFEIKLSQGAKPGKGGILPAIKVTEDISVIRGIPLGEASISPNRHPDINSEDDLLNMIEHIRTVTGKPVGIKTVVGDYQWVEDLCAEIDKRGPESAPDFITIDSADGGSGAAPMSLADYMGLPLRESLPKTINILEHHKLKDRIKIIASGKLLNPAGVAWALCCGADFVTSARGFMFALGCIQALQCDKNTCPTGITTHNKRMQKGLNPQHKAVRVHNYINNMQHEVGVIAHSCGVTEPRQLRRFHARIVTEYGYSVSLKDLYGDTYSSDGVIT